MNKIKLNIEGRGDGNDIERILDEVKKMKMNYIESDQESQYIC
jgi:hypothetical protein